MTKKELITALSGTDDDDVIVVSDEDGGWDNIIGIGTVRGTPCILFGGGSPFSDE